MDEHILFEALTPLGFRVRVTRARWQLITTTKHPAMHGRAADVQATLREPHEIRRSRGDPAVYLFYRLERPGRWTCGVAKRVNDEGFLITTYPADAVKAGELVWST
ncbi:MAG: DUF4258 domain-containing protein [Chloroflexi bacterium]|nr:DUF4258 domain-containing protein [Chloroflexota bacterium]